MRSKQPFYQIVFGVRSIIKKRNNGIIITIIYWSDSWQNLRKLAKIYSILTIFIHIHFHPFMLFSFIIWMTLLGSLFILHVPPGCPKNKKKTEKILPVIGLGSWVWTLTFRKIPSHNCDPLCCHKIVWYFHLFTCQLFIHYGDIHPSTDHFPACVEALRTRHSSETGGVFEMSPHTIEVFHDCERICLPWIMREAISDSTYLLGWLEF